ncbi:MAG: hypothetical protein JNK05_16965 [Myxococcales bacterium]|nr:hypothetical protein [Myxococcales bacterium]
MVDPRESSARTSAWRPLLLVSLALAGLTASPALSVARGRAARATPRSATAARVPIAVSVGWTQGSAERSTVVDALSRAIASEPNLRFAPTGGAVVINTNVRALTIQRDGADALARCELSMVVTDGRGAVQGMVETRRVVRSSGTEASAAQSALRDALTGAVHRLATTL